MKFRACFYIKRNRNEIKEHYMEILTEQDTVVVLTQQELVFLLSVQIVYYFKLIIF